LRMRDRMKCVGVVVESDSVICLRAPEASR